MGLVGSTFLTNQVGAAQSPSNLDNSPCHGGGNFVQSIDNYVPLIGGTHSADSAGAAATLGNEMHVDLMPPMLAPYSGDYSGCFWNAQGLYASQAHSQFAKLAHAGKLLDKHDFLCWGEVHGNVDKVMAASSFHGACSFWWWEDGAFCPPKRQLTNGPNPYYTI